MQRYFRYIGGIAMSICIEPVRLRAYGRNIDLEFKDRITLVSGNSGTGKTLIFELLNDI